ncbi:PAS domain-containing protein [uncultured Kriegella sp.]|uniref:PAS domain-containing protein n=1 Tax=uncultured Kriegella sp. TaxID=1798910 RepID=UPI0030D7B9D8
MTDTDKAVEVCKRILNRSSDIVFFIDNRGFVSWANIIGGEFKMQLSANIFIETIHIDDRENARDILEEVMGSGNGDAKCVCRHILQNGTTVVLEWTFSALADTELLSCLAKEKKGTTKEEEKVFRLEHLENEIMAHAMETMPNTMGVFNKYVEGIEKIFPDLKASILIVDNGRLRNLASPGLPKAYINLVNGLPIGPKVGSCGTAAFLKKRIIVEDIATDPLWEDTKNVALPFGLRACWSQPILNSKKEVIATFANYYLTIRKPTKKELRIFERLASLIGIILENHRNNKKLSSNSELFNYVNLATNDAIYDWDLKKDDFKCGHSFTRLFGHEVNGQSYSISKWTAFIHPDDLLHNRSEFLVFSKNPKAKRWAINYRFMKKNGMYAYVEEMAYAVRDKKGEIVRMIGVLSDITEKLNYIETVEEQNRRLKEIAWEQSHSVRAPVARLMWIIDLIRTEELTEEEKKILLASMLSSAEEIDTIIRSITEKTYKLKQETKNV